MLQIFTLGFVPATNHQDLKPSALSQELYHCIPWFWGLQTQLCHAPTFPNSPAFRCPIMGHLLFAHILMSTVSGGLSSSGPTLLYPVWAGLAGIFVIKWLTGWGWLFRKSCLLCVEVSDAFNLAPVFFSTEPALMGFSIENVF